MEVLRYDDVPYAVELTRRNLEVLLAKLDDEDSQRTIFKQGMMIIAVENEKHYGDREPGAMKVNGEVI